MHSSRRLAQLVPLAAIALLAAALLAPGADAAKIPPFSASAQYKALEKYVYKLEGLSGTPATSAQKAAYGDTLDNKHAAAENKANALFKRAKTAAKNEANRAFKASSRTVRRTESGELAALRKEYDARLDRAAAGYAAELGRIEDEFDARVTTLRKEIQKLRKQKAKAKSAIEKALIDDSIARRNARIKIDSTLEKEEIADLKTGYRKEKAAIRAAKSNATQLVLQNDDVTIQRLRTENNRIYNAKVRTLQSKRVNQLGDLEDKLDAGRAAIERMPASG
jgi:hypothetical protein